MTSEQESSSSNNLTKKIENELKKRGRSRNRIQNQSPNVKGWDKEPLSILWCLNSFDNKTKEDENLAQSRVILYDSNAKTVMAVEKLPSESGTCLKWNQLKHKTVPKFREITQMKNLDTHCRNWGNLLFFDKIPWNQRFSYQSVCGNYENVVKVMFYERK